MLFWIAYARSRTCAPAFRVSWSFTRSEGELDPDSPRFWWRGYPSTMERSPSSSFQSIRLPRLANAKSLISNGYLVYLLNQRLSDYFIYFSCRKMPCLFTTIHCTMWVYLNGWGMNSFKLCTYGKWFSTGRHSCRWALQLRPDYPYHLGALWLCLYGRQRGHLRHL